MTHAEIRAAATADVPAVAAVTDAAYRPYIERIGVAPVPMEADHAADVADVAAGKVFVDARARALGLPEISYTNAMMWENQKICPRFGYEVVERRGDGPYDRIHYRKRLV